MKRRWGLAALAAVLGLGLCGLLGLLRRPEVENRITHASFERLAPGMTRPAVDELLGVPPGDYVTEPVRFVRPVNPRLIEDLRRPPEGPETVAVWEGNQGQITVWFNDRGEVARRVYLPAAWDETLLARVRRWLGL